MAEDSRSRQQFHPHKSENVPNKCTVPEVRVVLPSRGRGPGEGAGKQLGSRACLLLDVGVGYTKARHADLMSGNALPVTASAPISHVTLKILSAFLVFKCLFPFML